MISFHVEGLRELDAALGDLPKATAKNTMRRVLLKGGEPIVDAAKRLAPELSGDLKTSLDVSTKLSARQKRENRRNPSQSYVEAYAGAGALPQAHLREFGADHHAPDPFMRPAWDSTQDEVLDGIKADLTAEIEKTRARLARKQARLIAKTGG